MKCKRIELTIWKWDGLVASGGRPSDFQALVKRIADHDITVGDNSAGHAFVAYGKPWLLWVQDIKDVPALAHEALHVAAGVIESRGMKHTPESEEAYTYTMEHIIRCGLSRKGWASSRRFA